MALGLLQKKRNSRGAQIVDLGPCIRNLPALGRGVSTCSLTLSAESPEASRYFDSSGRDDVLTGGVKLIAIQTPKGPLDKTNFYLFGQSWGGILAIEFALRYQQILKGLIISNMVASIPAYNQYAKTVLMPAMDQKVLGDIKALEAAGRFDDPRYDELAIQSY